jgi:outer membrane protein assembly factor BamB
MKACEAGAERGQLVHPARHQSLARTRLSALRTAIGVSILVWAASGLASDWPQLLGPTRNGIYSGPELAESWPKEGPAVVWQRQVGQGFSGPAVASGKLVLFHRQDEREVVECLEAGTGKALWSFGYPTAYHDDFGFDEGPRATPTIAEGMVYTYGAEGVLTCCELASGKKLWSVDAKRQFQAPKGFFGIGSSPLLEGNALLVNIGGRNGAGIVAFEKGSGKVLWKATEDEASYSSPVAVIFGSRHLALVLTRSELAAVEPANGEVSFRFPFQPPIRNSVTAAMPVVVGDLIFVSASYGTGAALLHVKQDGRGIEKLWSSDDALSCHYATAIEHDGFLYGIHGRTDPGFEPPASLRCVELKSGKLRWQQENFGAATLILAGRELLALTERGELLRVPASSEGFKTVARVQILPNQARAHPALADGLFYARSKDKLVCVDLRKH